MRRQFPKAKGSFYDIKAAVRAEGEPTATDLWIYDVIGDDWLDPSLTAKELCQRIAAIDTAEIVLHLASPGGSVSDGLAIYNALMSHPAAVTSRVEGWTASMATIVALAGETVTMFDNCLFMIHNPLMLCVGNARELREQADWLDRVGGIMQAIYMARCTKTEDELQSALDAETYLSADEALDWGFVTEVVATEQKAAAVADLGVFDAMGFRTPTSVGRALHAENEGRLREPAILAADVLAMLDRKAECRPRRGAGDASRTMDKKGYASILLASKRH
ncbi:MAG: head maturation protease, ClpP-related [Actinomycetes bacterium]